MSESRFAYIKQMSGDGRFGWQIATDGVGAAACIPYRLAESIPALACATEAEALAVLAAESSAATSIARPQPEQERPAKIRKSAPEWYVSDRKNNIGGREERTLQQLWQMFRDGQIDGYAQ